MTSRQCVGAKMQMQGQEGKRPCKHPSAGSVGAEWENARVCSDHFVKGEFIQLT